MCLGPVSVDRRAFKALCGGVSLSGRSCVRCGRVAVAVATALLLSPMFLVCVRALTACYGFSLCAWVGGVEAFVRLYAMSKQQTTKVKSLNRYSVQRITGQPESGAMYKSTSTASS